MKADIENKLPTSREIELSDTFRDEPILDADRDRKEGAKNLRILLQTRSCFLNFESALIQRGWQKTNGVKSAIRVLNSIFRYQKFFSKVKNGWVEISSNHGFNVSLSGSELRVIKDRLQHSRCIQIKRIKLYGEMGSKAYEYRFEPNFYTSVVERLKSEKPVYLKWSKTEKKPKQDITKSERHSILIQVKHNSEQLEVNWEKVEELYETLDTEEKWMLENSIRPFASEILDHHISEDLNGRIYSPYISIHRAYRPFIYHKDGKIIHDVDIKTCHPTFLYSLYQYCSEEEDKERRLYKKIITKGDFYGFIECGINKFNKGKPVERDRVKQLFSSFLNSDAWCDVEMELKAKNFKNYRAGKPTINAAGRVFIKKFPVLFERMKEAVKKNLEFVMSKKDKPCLGIALMAMEKDILDPVYSELVARGYFFIPCHDGFLVEDDALNLSMELLRRNLELKTGLNDKELIKIKKY